MYCVLIGCYMFGFDQAETLYVAASAMIGMICMKYNPVYKSNKLIETFFFSFFGSNAFILLSDLQRKI